MSIYRQSICHIDISNRATRTAGRGAIEESSSEREQLLEKRLRKHLRNLDPDLAQGKNEASGMSVKEE